MREITFDLSLDDGVPQYRFVGYEGEHNATHLNVILPSRMRYIDGGEYRFLFETAKGEAVFSAAVPVMNGQVSLPLVKTLMVSPILKAHVGVYLQEEGEMVLISKTSEMLLGVQKSVGEGEEVNVNGGCVPGLVIESAWIPESKNPVESGVISDALNTKVNRSDVKSSVNYQFPSQALIPSEKAVVGALEQKLSIANLCGEISEVSAASEESAPTEKAVARALEEKLSIANLCGEISEESTASEESAPTEKAVARALLPYMKAEDYPVDSALSSNSRNPVENRVVTAEFANALFGEITGTFLKISDLSPTNRTGKVMLKSTNPQTEGNPVSGGKLILRGKNLFDVGVKTDYACNFSNYIKTVSRQEQTITAPVLPASETHFVNTKNRYVPGTYTVSAHQQSGKPIRLLVRLYDEEGSELTGSQALIPQMTYNSYYKGWYFDGDALTFTVPASAAWWCLGFCPTGTVGGDAIIEKIFLVQENEAGEYEKCHTEEYVSDENGEIFFDWKGGEILYFFVQDDAEAKVTYSKDLNKVILALEEAICFLGGEV